MAGASRNREDEINMYSRPEWNHSAEKKDVSIGKGRNPSILRGDKSTK